MTQHPAPLWARGRRIVGALALLVAGLVTGCGSTVVGADGAAAGPPAAPRPVGVAVGGSIREPPRVLGEDDGAVPRGTTVFDGDVPAVANLDPALLAALRRAATDAGYHGIRFTVDSGWRSVTYQQQLLREAVATYGSEREAARWVAGPTTSAHVSGDAVDLAPARATAWLSAHGAAYGLCQIYRNEAWHYELRPDAVRSGCPAMYADAAADPRMHP